MNTNNQNEGAAQASTSAAERIIAIEEHFWTPRLRGLSRDSYTITPERASKLDDLGDVRLREMDEAGIDLQVMSLVQPGVQVFDPPTAVSLAREANDFLHNTIAARPDRFAGFAAIPTPDPQAAADELDRCVTKLGFKGAMVSGLTNDEFLDGERYWCIFERAEALDVPIYMHPAIPHRAVIEAYYNGCPKLVGAGWGFAIEVATHAARLIVGGVFDRFPNLKIILGHFGEALPFLSWRADFVIGHGDGLKNSFKDYFHRNFYVTTSSDFSYPAMTCALLDVGSDRILFAVDWPFRSNKDAVNYIRKAPISADDKRKIFSANAARILKL